MDPLLRNLINGSSISPPAQVANALHQYFSGALSVEWFINNDKYEAIFFIRDIEYIALFDLNGNLIEYHHNTDLNALPAHISEITKTKGEIMNVISIHRIKQDIQFEIIFRDTDLKRYSLLLTHLGEVIQENIL